MTYQEALSFYKEVDVGLSNNKQFDTMFNFNLYIMTLNIVEDVYKKLIGVK